MLTRSMYIPGALVLFLSLSASGPKIITPVESTGDLEEGNDNTRSQDAPTEAIAVDTAD